MIKFTAIVEALGELHSRLSLLMGADDLASALRVLGGEGPLALTSES